MTQKKLIQYVEVFFIDPKEQHYLQKKRNRKLFLRVYLYLQKKERKTFMHIAQCSVYARVCMCVGVREKVTLLCEIQQPAASRVSLLTLLHLGIKRKKKRLSVLPFIVLNITAISRRSDKQSGLYLQTVRQINKYNEGNQCQNKAHTTQDPFVCQLNLSVGKTDASKFRLENRNLFQMLTCLST